MYQEISIKTNVIVDLFKNTDELLDEYRRVTRQV